MLLPVALYVDKLGSANLSLSKSDWGTFGDYVGGILNPLIALFTLAMTVIIAITLQNRDKRDRIEELKKNSQPEFVSDLRNIFYANSNRVNEDPYPDNYSYIDYEKIMDGQRPQHIPFSIPIYNIGPRTAKDVTFDFKIDFDEVVSVLNAVLEKNKYEGKITITDVANKQLRGKLNFEFSDLMIRSIPLVFKNPSQLSHLLNVDISPEPYRLQIPTQFLELYSGFIFFNYWQLKGSQKDVKFPGIKLLVEVSDIYGHKYKMNFLIQIEYWWGFENITHQISVTRL